MKSVSTLRVFPSSRESLAFAGTVLSVGSLANPALGAPADPPADEDGEVGDLGELVVDAEENAIYRPERLASPKFQQAIEDIPQTLSVIPKEVIREQNATTLRDVLRNTPGISMQAGEGGVRPGDNLSIRGFNAQTDLYVDGVRDFGGYSRDPFNLEQVEVAKGPASTNSGRGSTGGSVNLVSKKPLERRYYDIMLGGGTDDYFRGTVDMNETIPWVDGAAFRLNMMYHNADTPGRDSVHQERWGFAPSVTFGLGTATRTTFSYFYLGSDDMPDYGIPWVPASNTALPWARNMPAPVDYNNFYGLESRDYLKNNTHILSAEVEHDFSDNLRLRNLTRYGHTTTDLSVTAPRFSGTGTTIRRTDWKTRDQVDTIFANQTDLNFEFDTGSLRHEAVAGLEVARETSKNYGRSDLNPATPPNTDLFFPNPSDYYVAYLTRNGFGTTSESWSASAYLFDTIEINPCWMFSGGLRFDHFDTVYDSYSIPRGGTVPVRTHASNSDNVLSYRGAVTWKPVEQGSVYLAYGTSYNPSAEGLTLSNSATANNSVNTDPEESNTIELGTKWSVFDDRLLLTAAVFRTDKDNARTPDPVTGITTLNGEQRVQGFELGASGSVTDWWRVIAGYAYLDSEILTSGNPAEIGNQLSNTPEHSLSLWNVFDLPAGITFGVGTSYVGDRFSNNSNSRTAPSYWLVDAMVGYQVTDNVLLQLNVTNLLDEDYIDRVGGGHAVPGNGRAAVISTRFTF